MHYFLLPILRFSRSFLLFAEDELPLIAPLGSLLSDKKNIGKYFTRGEGDRKRDDNGVADCGDLQIERWPSKRQQLVF